jgi:hypothetical protein
LEKHKDLVVMLLPQIIAIPLPENLPFIDSKFREARQISTVSLKLSGSSLVSTEDESRACRPKAPCEVGDDALKSFASLSQSTFETLLSIIRPNISGRAIHNAKELERATLQHAKGFREFFVLDSKKDSFTHDQLKFFLLMGANFEKHADWRKVAELYNEAPDDQKTAINAFFVNMSLSGIEPLLGAGPALPLPDVFPLTKTQKIEGETYAHCDIANGWIRDDLFHRQFKITLTHSYSNEPTVIAYAGTLEQAIARATQFTLNKNGLILDPDGKPKLVSSITQKTSSSAVCIYFERDTSSSAVAIAKLSYHLKILPDSTAERDCKLEWGPCKMPAFAGKTFPITDKAFRSALYATEKQLGVQWSKAHHLEDALGL